jgi:hypothetical protein
MDRALGAVDVENHPLRARVCRRMLNQIRVHASQTLVVPLLGEDLRLEPLQRRRQRDARLPSLPRGEHSKRRVLGQPLGVIRVRVPGETAIDRLTNQVGQRELGVAPGAGSMRYRSITALRPRRSSNSRGNNNPASEVTVAPRNSTRSWGVERDANRSRFGVTHWMMPSARAMPRRSPHFLRALSDYGLVASPHKTKMRA